METIVAHNGCGALPDHYIKGLIEGEHILGAKTENVGAASLDFTLSEEMYRVPGLSLPRSGQTVRSLIESLGGVQHSAYRPLERNGVYVCRLRERLALPEGLYGCCNPKSSTGRLNVRAWVLADGVPRFDAIPSRMPSGSSLWAVIHPASFPVITRSESLSQMRFFNLDTRLTDTEIKIEMSRCKLVRAKQGKVLRYNDCAIHDHDGSIILTADLSGEIIGYECIEPNAVLDLSERNHYDPRDFFRPLYKRGNGFVSLRGNRFYLLRTKEFVSVPPMFACEMEPVDRHTGDFSAHEAGFVDPGWGWGATGDIKGRPLTLEVTPRSDIELYDEHPIAKIRFERMADEPEAAYDARSSSHYRSNEVFSPFSKHFKKS